MIEAMMNFLAREYPGLDLVAAFDALWLPQNGSARRLKNVAVGLH